MVAIFTGAGTGFERGSGNVVGAAGLLGSAAQGRGGDNLFFNAANGNLLISRQDEFLVGRGPDVGISRTYNSLGDMTDDNQDNWRHSYDRRVFGLTGILNTAGSTIKRRSGDGSEITYTWNDNRAAYFATEGAGAYDELSFAGGTNKWTWTDGDSQVTEVYGASGSDWRIESQSDTSGNSLTFSYNNDGRLTRVTTANDEYTQLGWSGNNLTEIAVYGTGSNNLLLTRTRYVYDGSNRLITVTVDKSPSDSSVADGKSYVTTYTYHTGGNGRQVATITQTDGSSVAFDYDTAGRIETITQTVANGVARTTEISYLTEVEDNVTKKYTEILTAGLKTRLDYDENNFLTKVTSPAPADGVAAQTVKFGYNAKGDLTSVTDAAGQVTSYTHDGNGNVVSVEDRLDNLITRKYGDKNELLWETRTGVGQTPGDPSLRARFVYDDDNRLVATISAEGRVTRFNYDGYGQLLSTQTVTATAFDVGGLGLVDVVPWTQVRDWYRDLTDKSQVMLTVREYDARGNLDLEKTGAATAAGDIDSIQGWSQTDYLYDQSGQLLSRTKAGLSTEHYAYDGLGRTIASTDLGGAKTTIVFHDAATTTTVSVEGGTTRTSVYNKAGELVSTSESPAAVVSENLKPDLTNPAQWNTGSLAVAPATSIAGQPAYLYTVTTTGGGGSLSSLGTVNAGETTSFEITLKAQGNTPTHYLGIYGTAGGWEALTSAEVISGPGTVAQSYGAMWSISGLSTTQETRVRVTRTSSVTETALMNFYVGAVNGAQPGDNVILSAPSVTRTTPQPAGPTTEYLYDGLGRLRSTIQHTDVQGNNGYAQHIVYDNAGRMTAQVDHTGAVTEYRYDVNNRVIATTRYANKLSAENLTQVANPNSGVSIGMIRPTGHNDDLWTWTSYDAEGRVTRAIDGDGTTTAYTYDASGQVIKTIAYITRLPSTALNALKVDPTATVSLPGTHANDNITRAFYDKDGRLIGQLNAMGYLSEVVYDKAGRKVQERSYANPTSWTLFATGTFDQLRTSAGTSTSDRSTRYVYDGQGLLRYQIDSLNQVVGYVYSDGVTAAGTTHGQARQTIAYSVPIGTPASYTVTGVEAAIASALTAAGSQVAAETRNSWAVYDTAGRLAYAIGADGLVTSYTYNTLGQVIKTVAFATSRVTTSLPSKGDMDNWVASNAANPDNRVTRSYYNGYGDLAYLVDPEGYVTETTYDPLRRIHKTIRHDKAVAPTDSWTTSTVAGADKGNATTTTAISLYDHLGRVEKVEDAIGTTTRNVYSATGLLTQTTVAYGTADAVTTAFTYDAAGRVLTRTDAQGTAAATITAYEYDGVGNLLKLVVASGTPDEAVTAYEYDVLGRIRKETVGFGTTDAATTTYAYNTLGDYKRIDDARGNSTYYYFDNLGRVVKFCDPEKYVTETSYTVFGEVATTTRRYNRATNEPHASLHPIFDPHALDAVTRYEYNRLGQVVRMFDAGNYQTDTDYTVFGEVQSVTKAGATTSFEYDKLGQVKTTTDAATKSETYTYDAFGRRTSVTNKLGGVTSYTYNSRGLLTLETIGVSGIYGSSFGTQTTTIVNKFEYDLRGNLKESIEAFGASEARTTKYSYDALNRVVSKTGMQVATGLTGALATPTETYVYDRRGNVIETKFESIAEGGAFTPISRSFAYYDDLNRTVARINPLGAATTYSYDKNSNLLSTRAYDTAVTLPTTPGGVVPTLAGTYRETTNTYDKLNRLTDSSVADVRAGSWNGSAFAISTGTVTTAYLYDAHSNVIKTTDANGNSVFAYYDALGRKTAQVDQELYLTTWTHDANGNVKIERRHATKVASASIGTPPSVANHVDDRVTEFDYDLLGRRTQEKRIGVAAWSINASNGALVAATGDAAINYTYNALGQVASKLEANGDATTYIYDDAGRLIVEQRAIFVDFGGNVVSPTVRYFYDRLDQLTSTRQGVFATEASDRITTNSYTAGRLASTTDAANFTRHYHYDIAGRVVAESYERTLSNGGKVTEAVVSAYDAAGQVVTQSFMRKEGANWVNTDASNQAYVSTHMRYNAHGEMTGRGMATGLAAPASYQEFFDYDAAGRMWRTNSGDGVTKFMVYDKAGNQTLSLTSTGGDLSGLTASSYTNSIDSSGDTTLTGAVTSINVYDKRGMVVETREPDRELKLGTPQETVTIIRKRAYNAFGEVASETDARNYTTTFAYNTMGRLITKVSPQVSATAENGTVSTINPTEHYRYDISGRMIATVDANGNTRARALLAGTGHGGSEALVTHMFNADGADADALPDDGGVLRTFYDRFGDARILRNELGSTNSSTSVDTATDEQHVYDKMGRATTIIRRGGLLTESYAYDELGQNIQQWNSFQGDGLKALTDYDIQGRVVSNVAIGGDTATTAYLWQAGLTTSMGGASVTFGGWQQTTTYANGRTSIQREDLFGRAVQTTDLGGNVATIAYDRAGRLISRAVGMETATYQWLNSGLVAQITTGYGDPVGAPENAGQNYNITTQTSTYDANGNKLTEQSRKDVGTWRTYSDGYDNYDLFFPDSKTLQNAVVTYDALNRMVTWDELGSDLAPIAGIEQYYDANGNIRRTKSDHKLIHSDGTLTDAATDHWYRFDSMNRVVTAKGVQTGSGIVRGGQGVDIFYDVAGNRVQTMRTVIAYGQARGEMAGWPEPEWQYYDVPYQAELRENYTYWSGGQLREVRIAKSGYADNYNGTVSPTELPAIGALKASYWYDALGRLQRQIDWTIEPQEGDNNYALDRAAYDRSLTYNDKGQVTFERTFQRDGTTTQTTDTYNYYDSDYNPATIGDYALGALVRSTTSVWRTGTQFSTSSVTNSYQWRDGAQLSSASLTGTTTGTTAYQYSGMGVMTKAVIADGRPRNVTFTTDVNGQVIRREEADNQSGGDPQEIWYRFNGRQLGQTGNDGTLKTDYQGSVDGRTLNQGTGAFHNGASYGSAYADFDQFYDPITSHSQGSSGGAYTVRAGDTLQGIAAAMWGDASLWYKLAEANGLSAGSALTEGQTLNLPAGVQRSQHNASTFAPYDPAETLGDTSPTTPTPQKPKKNKCGVLGAILIAVVAVAVTIASAGAALSLTGAVKGGFMAATKAFLGVAGAAKIGVGVGIAAGAVGGAVGSLASQGVGIAIGMQDKINWGGVAMAGLAGGISGGLSAWGAGAKATQAALDASTKAAGSLGTLDKIGLFLSKGGAVAGAARGAVSSIATQGIAALFGHKFDFAGVATASLGGLVSGEVGSWLGDPGSAGEAIGKTFLTSTASGISNAAARSLIHGTSFGDNMLAALPDIVAQTIGSAISAGISGTGRKPRNGSVALGGCFVAGTIVHSEAGPRAINDIRVGERVWSRHEDQLNGATSLQTVSAVMVYHERPILRVTYSTSEPLSRLILTTEEHPFYVLDRGWVEAGDLVSGDTLLLACGGHAVVQEIALTGGTATVYNITVEEDHTYFVGDDRVWVHNKTVGENVVNGIPVQEVPEPSSLELAMDRQKRNLSIILSHGVENIDFFKDVMEKDQNWVDYLKNKASSSTSPALPPAQQAVEQEVVQARSLPSGGSVAAAVAQAAPNFGSAAYAPGAEFFSRFTWITEPLVNRLGLRTPGSAAAVLAGGGAAIWIGQQFTPSPQGPIRLPGRPAEVVLPPVITTPIEERQPTILSTPGVKSEPLTLITPIPGRPFSPPILGTPIPDVQGPIVLAAETAAPKAWTVGDDIYALTAKGNEPAWSTVRGRFWKNEAASPQYGTWDAQQLDRMRRGLAPQRYNLDKGGIESMDLSHEPIPFRDGGRGILPRWPQDHAAVDPYRRPGY